MNTAKLISQVYIRSSLWDQQDKQYTNRRFTDQLWDEVAQEMSSSKEAIKSKWKNLRDAYRKEFKKNQGDNANGQVMSQWAYFKQMSFIKDQMFPTPGYSENSTQSTSSEYVECGDQDNAETMNYHYLSENVDDNLLIQQKRKRMFNVEIENIDQRRINVVDPEYLKNIDGYDEDKYFFLSLIPSLKILPVTEKLSLRIKIQQLILVHIGKYENSVSTPHGNEDKIEQEECRIKTEMIDIPDYSDNAGVFEAQENIINNIGDLQNDSEILPPQANISPNISEQHSEVAENVSGRDEYAIYGEYIACKLRKLPNARVRSIAQHLINNVIFRAEMGKFDNATFYK